MGGSLEVEADVAAAVAGVGSAAGFGLGYDNYENLGQWIKRGRVPW